MFFVLRISDLRASSNKKGMEANSYAARCTIPPVALAVGLACLPYLTLGPPRDKAVRSAWWSAGGGGSVCIVSIYILCLRFCGGELTKASLTLLSRCALFRKYGAPRETHMVDVAMATVKLEAA